MQYLCQEIEEAAVELLTLVLETHCIIVQCLLVSFCKVIPDVLPVFYLKPLIPALSVVSANKRHNDKDNGANDKKRKLPISGLSGGQ
jgi:hypothetical protein